MDWVGVAWESDKNFKHGKIDDGILLMVPACIYGHKVCALVDCYAFVDSVVFLVTPCGFPIFLNIGHVRQGRLLSDGRPNCHSVAGGFHHPTGSFFGLLNGHHRHHTGEQNSTKKELITECASQPRI